MATPQGSAPQGSVAETSISEAFQGLSPPQQFGPDHWKDEAKPRRASAQVTAPQGAVGTPRASPQSPLLAHTCPQMVPSEFSTCSQRSLLTLMWLDSLLRCSSPRCRGGAQGTGGGGGGGGGGGMGCRWLTRDLGAGAALPLVVSALLGPLWGSWNCRGGGGGGGLSGGGGMWSESVE